MFKLRIDCKEKEWNSYIEAQCIENKEGMYEFSSQVKAVDILSRYIMYMTKQILIKQIIDKHWITEEQTNDIFVHAPNSMITAAYTQLVHEVNVYVSEHDSIEIEGFLSFRTKKSRSIFSSALTKGYENFCDIDLNDSIQLKEIMQNQQSLESEMFLIINEQLKMTLRSLKQVYFDAHADPDDYETEDTIVSHLVMASPKKLHVFDPYDKLSKGMVIILRQLFEEKVRFYHEEYAQDTH